MRKLLSACHDGVLYPYIMTKSTRFPLLLAALLWSLHAASQPAGEPALSKNTTDPPAVWIEPVTGMEFVLITGNCYVMGSPTDESGRYEDEVQRDTCIDDFWLAKYEVTNHQFRSFVRDSDYRTTSEQHGEGFGISRAGANDWGWRKGITWKHPLSPEDTIAAKMQHPVVQVSWIDAHKFVEWLTDKHGGTRTFRLPYESEWEFGCRAGTTTARFWGEPPDQACKYASVADSTAKAVWPTLTVHNCTDGYETTAPVGQFQPNDWQIHDMLGNVWEWTEDEYDDREKNPAGELPHSESDPLRVLRGGSWIYGPRHVRCAFRNVMSATGRSYSTGFRIVMERIK